MLDSYQTEFRVLRAYPHNVLLEGPADATDAVLDVLRPHMGEPLPRHVRHGALDLPQRNTRGLILHDVSTLTADDQTRLRIWLGREGARTQVVSTTVSPLFAFVARGLFDVALYYRLNVLLLRFPHQSRTEEAIAADPVGSSVQTTRTSSAPGTLGPCPRSNATA
jgi:hypothetical protein